MGEHASFAVCGVEPARVIRPETREDLAREVASAAASGEAVIARGEGTRMSLGAAPKRLDRVILTSGLSRVVTYEPAEMVITVEAGLGMAALNRLLSEQRQFLPLQPYRQGGTIGGLVATAEDGALALGCGRVRDLLVGLRVVLADGSIARGRGAVVKNVAGYDVPRLMAGALGTLGIIVEVSLRLLPLPACQGSLLQSCRGAEEAFEGAGRLIDGPLEPVFVNVLSDAGDVSLAAGFNGTRAAVAERMEAAAKLLRQRGREPERLTGQDSGLRSRLDDPARELGGGGAAVIRVTALPVRIRELAREIDGLAAARGADICWDARPGLGTVFIGLKAGEPREEIVTSVLSLARMTGAATLISEAGGSSAADRVWGPPPGDFALMRRIKEELDPDGVFAPGRYVGGI